MHPSVVAAPGVARALFRLALPVLAEQFLSMLVGLSDTLLTGHYLSQQHLAAINQAGYTAWLFFTFFTVITVGATAMVARFVGAQDGRTANRVTNQAVLAGLLLAAPGTLAAALLVEPLVGAMQLPAEPAALAIRYLQWLIPALPAVMLQAVTIACLHGAGDTLSGLLAMICVNVVNVVVSWALTLGVGPLPQLGWDGIALGTAVGHVAGAALLVAWLLRGRAGLRLRLAELRPDGSLMRRLLRIGVPGGVDALAVVFCQLWFLAIVNQLGSLAAAAHGIAIRIEALAFLPGTAFQVGAATLAGQFLGAHDFVRARRSVVVASCWCGGLMSLAGVVFFCGAEPLAQLFVRAEEVAVARQAAPLLRIVSLSMPALALMLVLIGALRGSGDTRWPLSFTLIGFLLVRIPLAYLLAHVWGWGVSGAWYAMVADIYARALLVFLRFRHGGWQRVRV